MMWLFKSNHLKRIVRNATAPFRRRIVALLYHRISRPESDPWNLSVSPQNFAEQLAFLHSQYNVMNLKALPDTIKNGDLPKRGVVLTFDDGYADNFWFAKPLLEKFELPATFFVAGDLIDTDGFWWDELEWAVLRSTNIPKRLHIKINTRSLELPTTNFEQRQQAYFTLHRHLQPLKTSERNKVMEELFVLTGSNHPRHRGDRPLTTQELIGLSQSNFVEIGAHTSTHAYLSILSSADQVTEIEHCRKKLKAILGTQVDAFAFPYGNFSPETLDIVRAAGYKTALTCQRTVIERGSNLFQLGRFAVGDWDADVFDKNLRAFFLT